MFHIFRTIVKNSVVSVTVLTVELQALMVDSWNAASVSLKLVFSVDSGCITLFLSLWAIFSGNCPIPWCTFSQCAWSSASRSWTSRRKDNRRLPLLGSYCRCSWSCGQRRRAATWRLVDSDESSSSLILQSLPSLLSQLPNGLFYFRSSSLSTPPARRYIAMALSVERRLVVEYGLLPFSFCADSQRALLY